MNDALDDSTVLHTPVIEVQGWFPDHLALATVVDKLRNAGYVHADAVLPDEHGRDDSGPTPVDHQQLRTLTASLAGTAGAMLAGIAVLASGAAIPLAAAAAVAGGLGSGTLIEGMGRAAVQKQTDEQDERGAGGTLMLAMRVKEPPQADEVERIMRESGATEIKPILRPDEALVPEVNAAAWTG